MEPWRKAIRDDYARMYLAARGRESAPAVGVIILAFIMWMIFR